MCLCEGDMAKEDVLRDLGASEDEVDRIIAEDKEATE